jgi:hypothetical protein
VSLIDDLADGLEEELDGAAEAGDAPSPASLEHAVQQGRRLAAVARRRGRIAAIAEAEINRIQDWASRLDAPLAERAQDLEEDLARIALAQRAAGGPKMLSTPHVEVRTRTVHGEWTASPEAVEWAKGQHPDWVQKKETLLVSVAKRTLILMEGGVLDPGTGEMVPGIEVAPDRVAARVALLDGGGRG